MPLQSIMLSGNARLQGCLIRDSDHVTPGNRGFYVELIQAALIFLDGAEIDPDEVLAGRYGASTADAVLQFKKNRAIINKSYQTNPDNIVGKMTIAQIDKELLAKQAEAKKSVPPLPRIEHEPPGMREQAARLFIRSQLDEARKPTISEHATRTHLHRAIKR